MLSYWILRNRTDAPIGLVRVDQDRVLLILHCGEPMDFRLFSETGDAAITPDEPVRLEHAEALLGTQNGTLAAFAASPMAKPKQSYWDRLSRICTKKEEPKPAAPAEEVPEPTVEEQPQGAPNEEPKPAEPPHFSDISDTVRATEAFSLLLKRAEAFYARFDATPMPAVDNLVQKEDNEAPRGIDLFPQLFPGARWRYVQGKDLLAHYEGEYRYPNGESIRILAVRAKFAPRPPRTLIGFTRFVRSPDGTGYWLKIDRQ